MATLQIHLQEGFSDDPVIVHVNGQEVFRKEGVTTKLLLGYAETATAQIAEGSASVEIALPARNLSETITLQAVGTIHLGLSRRSRRRFRRKRPRQSGG